MIFYNEPNHTLYQGHALDVLRELPDESVDMAMTSPPYWELRIYKTEPMIWGGDPECEHAWGSERVVVCGRNDNAEKGGKLFHGTSNKIYAGENRASQGNFCTHCHAWKGELGLEPTVELYISHLVQIFNEVKRVLKKTGTCWVVIDDSYAGGKGQSGSRDAEFQNQRHERGESLNTHYQTTGGYGYTRPTDGNIGVPAKSLCAIPARFQIAMIDAGWICRNDICWQKNNPMPESVKDRFTTSWEHIYFFSKSKKYWFQQQFEPHQSTESEIARQYSDGTKETEWATNKKYSGGVGFGTQGRNKRDVWLINTQPCVIRGVHYASYPEKLCETPILAGCPSEVCTKCGKPRFPIYKRKSMVIKKSEGYAEMSGNRTATSGTMIEPNEVELTGYTDCGCGEPFIGGTVLDPFLGIGTTLAVAKKLGRKGIGIELSDKYCQASIKRISNITIGMELGI